MIHHPEFAAAPCVERLKTLANLVELALYAPEGEVTYDGRVALQRAAREIVLLAGEVIATPQGQSVGASSLTT